MRSSSMPRYTSSVCHAVSTYELLSASTSVLADKDYGFIAKMVLTIMIVVDVDVYGKEVSLFVFVVPVDEIAIEFRECICSEEELVAQDHSSWSILKNVEIQEILLRISTVTKFPLNTESHPRCHCGQVVGESKLIKMPTVFHDG
jgi:hypothetical protein